MKIVLNEIWFAPSITVSCLFTARQLTNIFLVFPTGLLDFCSLSCLSGNGS